MVLKAVSLSKDKSVKPGKSRQKFPQEKVAVLYKWLSKNLDYPYPTEAQRDLFVQQTGFNARQITDWFINARRRKVPQMRLVRGQDPHSFKKPKTKGSGSASDAESNYLMCSGNSSLYFNSGFQNGGGNLPEQKTSAISHNSVVLSPLKNFLRPKASFEYAYVKLKTWERNCLNDPAANIYLYNMHLLTEAAYEMSRFTQRHEA